MYETEVTSVSVSWCTYKTRVSQWKVSGTREKDSEDLRSLHDVTCSVEILRLVKSFKHPVWKFLPPPRPRLTYSRCIHLKDSEEDHLTNSLPRPTQRNTEQHLVTEHIIISKTETNDKKVWNGRMKRSKNDPTLTWRYFILVVNLGLSHKQKVLYVE